MLKLIIALLLTCFWQGTVNCQIRLIREANAEILKDVEFLKTSQIKRVISSRFDIIDGKEDPDSTLISEKFYNANTGSYFFSEYYPDFSKREIKLELSGKIARQVIYNNIGEISSSLVYTYSADGKILTKNYYFGNSLAFSETYNYEGNVLVNMTASDTARKTRNKTVFESDNESRITKEIKYGNSDSIDFIYEYTYDDRGNCIEDKLSLGQYELASISRFQYDFNGRLTENSAFTSKGLLLNKEVFTYYDNGMTKKIQKTGSDDKILLIREFTLIDGLIKECRIIDNEEQNEYVLKYYYFSE